jgi:WD40 repeat protein
LDELEKVNSEKKWPWLHSYMNKKLSVQTHIMENVEVLENKLHNGWISRVEYIPELNSVMTCSLDSVLTRFDPEANSVIETYTHHNKGVLSFAWCKDFKFMASCGEERHVTLWNPYTKSSAITYLYGHNSAVQDVVLNDDKFQLISLGTDKVVKVWDVRNYRCV